MDAFGDRGGDLVGVGGDVLGEVDHGLQRDVVVAEEVDELRRGQGPELFGAGDAVAVEESGGEMEVGHRPGAGHGGGRVTDRVGDGLGEVVVLGADEELQGGQGVGEQAEGVVAELLEGGWGVAAGWGRGAVFGQEVGNLVQAGPDLGEGVGVAAGDQGLQAGVGVGSAEPGAAALSGGAGLGLGQGVVGLDDAGGEDVEEASGGQGGEQGRDGVVDVHSGVGGEVAGGGGDLAGDPQLDLPGLQGVPGLGEAGLEVDGVGHQGACGEGVDAQHHGELGVAARFDDQPGRAQGDHPEPGVAHQRPGVGVVGVEGVGAGPVQGDAAAFGVEEPVGAGVVSGEGEDGGGPGGGGSRLPSHALNLYRTCVRTPGSISICGCAGARSVAATGSCPSRSSVRGRVVSHLVRPRPSPRRGAAAFTRPRWTSRIGRSLGLGARPVPWSTASPTPVG
nr:hypothetical protein [Marmoricola sp. Leaf446]